MNVLNKKPNKLAEDEMSAGDISENNMGDDSLESEEEEQVSESGDESSSEDKGHLFPTPPPDADADAIVTAEAMPVKIASKKIGPKTILIDMALTAIGALKSRSGSSIRAIVKYILSNGHEVPNEKRFSRTLFKRLKDAAASGIVIQEKLSFKLPVAAAKQSKLVEKVNSKSIEKMKEKAVKQKLVKKQEAKAQQPDAEQVEGGAKGKKVTKKATVPKTTETTAQKKKKADQAAVKKNAKMPKNQTSKPESTEPVEANNNGSLDAAMGEKAKKQKAKPPARKSIGTLAQTHAKRKPQVNAIKKLTSGKAALRNPDDIDSDMDEEPTQASTPVTASKQKGKGQKRKAN